MNSRTLSFVILSAILGLGAAACGGGGGGGGVAPQAQAPAPAVVSQDTTGVVAILLKDAPTDDFLRIEITLTRVELIGNGAPQVVFEGERTFNLLDLQNFYDMLAVSDQVAVGTYDKIRLRVTRVLLVRDDGQGGEETFVADLPANGRIDLNPRGSFRVAPDTAILIEIDMDATRSIHVVGTGSGRFKFRPVVFVDVQERQLLNGLAVVHGTIGEIAADDSSFELCDVDTDFGSRVGHCVIVNVIGGETSLFDENGDPIVVADVRMMEPPVEATVYGIAVVSSGAGDWDYDSDSASDDGDSDGDSDSDGGDSDADSDSDGGSDADGSSDDDSDSDSDDNDTVRMVQIDAIVVQVGPEGAALRLSGIALSALDDDDRFEFDPDAGQGLTDDSLLSVLVQDATRILSSDLTELDTTAIDAGVRLDVAGVLEVGDTDLLKAALILVLDDEEAIERLRGEILEVLDPTFRIAAEGGDRCIAPVEAARYFIADDSSGSLDVVEGSLADLEAGQQATVFGVEGSDGCFAADLIFVEPAAPSP